MYFLNVFTLQTLKCGLIYGGTLVCIAGVGILVSSLIVGRMVYNTDNYYYEESIDVEMVPILDEFKDVEKYNDNYLEEFKLLEQKELTEEQIDNLKNNVVFDETPLGRIVMMYDKDLEGFRWYCNTSHITYETLSTLARKYVIHFDCKCLYISLKDELKKNKMILDKTIIEAKKTNANQKVNLLTRKDVQEKLLIKNNIIRFKYGGKLYEYENKHTSNHEPTSKKKITFSDFKRLEKLSQKKND
uniref:Uncharacterized protein n=1 Tax=Megaviridae environmental sample TaxID=1737588 RepID=A0A5J6VML1_9VIRU|nr:MAG: hypothetical protein [Megaviridae environmental sample]